MHVKMLGCGDAYDPQKTNSSLLISEGEFKLLIDCGPTVPQALFANGMTAEDISCIYISHCHPDHCLGLTTLLNYMKSFKRSKPLTIFRQASQHQALYRLMEFAYWPERDLGFDLHWQDSEDLAVVGPWNANTTASNHSVPNRSLQLKGEAVTLFYSGDGLLSPEGEQLAAQADLAFIECEYMTAANGHGSWADVKDLPRKAGSRWVLYHIDDASRPAVAEAIKDYSEFSLGEDGREFELSKLKA
ncbi:Ribonuclease BN, tRNA processing enzyme [Pseudovibrio ascidiaceicola]|uniref:Ribonuclease BN, tRNA processing enzyme n=1 Tax=Pseudovibrio ascidiaceicola TaxID=285279 RepID=A0A1I3ZSN6_9HYPH|nr:MBL fold metallo-hydrolase [Pseudovibrio ascidiaceicola]SFK47095.1 Ribonuclease BN, tRNA processing enzyme [Pseudovibrio ascidiaceicola]